MYVSKYMYRSRTVCESKRMVNKEKNKKNIKCSGKVDSLQMRTRDIKFAIFASERIINLSVSKKRVFETFDFRVSKINSKIIYFTDIFSTILNSMKLK